MATNIAFTVPTLDTAMSRPSGSRPRRTSRAAATPAYFLGRPASMWTSALRRRR